ncbi:GNAT family N-acetyltransferase [Bacteroidales bacterium OttesenSCG-928-E04]|nr:GNAT family N-acetyltransferase [Bacteroidales bacterium OttesenSCG-928-E04]MDL2326490.1 GNAT family N-acetyltransferase [Bacteroidales bacterium OttesenSCG-928-A14]
MELIIPPVDIKLIEKELTPDKFVRKTNVGGKSIYILNAHNAPNTMLEIGRLREFTFRNAGGGTGKSVDIDEYDTAEVPFQQLIVWNEEEKEIISAYRFILAKDVPLDENGYPHTPTSKMFYFSNDFIQNQWGKCIELGRSFVQPKHQATASRRENIFALDNVWDGLGALIHTYPEMEYFIGKMTMYNNYNQTARKLILDFLNHHFKGDPGLISPIIPPKTTREECADSNPFNNSSSSDENFKLLNQKIRDLQEKIPPLIKTYLSLSPTIKYFGIAPNASFGSVEEMCILISISEIYEKKKNRHVKF